MRTSSVGALVPFISADGGVFMCFFVIKDKKAHQLSLVIPKESKHRRSWPRQYAPTKSGFVDKRLQQETMDAFAREDPLIHPGLDCIVFMDNCAVHRDGLLGLTDLQNNLVLDLARKGTRVYLLPPNTTAWNQPLDGTCFGNLKGVLGEGLLSSTMPMAISTFKGATPLESKPLHLGKQAELGGHVDASRRRLYHDQFGPNHSRELARHLVAPQ